MKKFINVFLKIVFSLLLISPILGSLGIFPPPTAEMYKTPEAFAFISMLMDSGYVTAMMSVAFFIAIICLWTGRGALAALLVLPCALNIVGFHAFLDGGLFTAGALMGNILFLINIYFLWKYRNSYKNLFQKS